MQTNNPHFVVRQHFIQPNVNETETRGESETKNDEDIHVGENHLLEEEDIDQEEDPDQKRLLSLFCHENPTIVAVAVALILLLCTTYVTLYVSLVLTSNRHIQTKCPKSHVWWFVLYMCVWQFFRFVVTSFIKSQEKHVERLHSWSKCGILLNHCLLVAVDMFFTFSVLVRLVDTCVYVHFNSTLFFAITFFVCISTVVKWLYFALFYFVAVANVIYIMILKKFYPACESDVAENESDGV